MLNYRNHSFFEKNYYIGIRGICCGTLGKVKCGSDICLQCVIMWYSEVL